MIRLILAWGLAGFIITGCTEQAVKSEDALIEGRALSAADYLALRVLPEKSEIAAGRRLPLSVVGILPYGHDSDLTKIGNFESSDPEVLEFSKDEPGVAIAMKAGKVTVTFTYAQLEGTTDITVADRVLDQLHVSPESLQVAINKVGSVYEERRITMEATGLYSDGSSNNLNSQVTWTLSNTASLAFVSGKPGVFLTKAPGRTVVTATIGSKVESQTIEVIQGRTALKSLSISPTPLIFPLQTARDIEVTALYTDGTTAIVTDAADYALNPSSLAIVQNNGSGGMQIASQATGNGTLSVSYKDINADFLLGAVDAEASTLRIESPHLFSLAKGQSETFQLWLNASDGTQENVTTRATWSLSNSTILTAVTGVKGRYTAARTGTTTIKAVLGGLTVSQNVTVTAATVSSIAVTSASSGTLGLYQTRDFVATATYTDASTKVVTTDVTWSFIAGTGAGSYDATVKSRFQGTGSGIGTIKATLGSVIGTQDIVIGGVIAVALNLQASWTSLSLITGSKQLSAYILYSDGSSQDKSSLATWNYEIVGTGLNFAGYVDNSANKGLCVPLATGFYKVNATYAGFTGEKLIQVTP